ncbi:MAG: thiamine biosynthesis protein [Acidobacteriota bacterium]|jgi:tRNA U34 2-thiouridine synthase MnmA/TrmU
MSEQIRALGLLSGGLDSTLAARVMQEQGIEVLGLHFSTGFCLADRHRILGNRSNPDRPYRNEALRAGADLQVPIEIIDIKDEYLPKVVLNPKHGYGSGMNPCIDCRIFMLQKTKAIMEERGFHFVFTGEVLGQRPMSQRRPPLNDVEKESGLEGLLLRPLSAKLLPATLPEQHGWVDRERLYDISGRSRKRQMELAEELGIIDYPQPAGGCCFLPDENYARKLKDFLAHHGTDVSPDDMMLLKVGRHFRLSGAVKAVVGRDEGENAYLNRFVEGRTEVWVDEYPSPLTLLEGAITAADLETACRITARYSDGRNMPAVPVRWRAGDDEGQLTVQPLQDDTELEEMRI